MASKSDLSRPILQLQPQPKQALNQRLIMSAHMQQAIHLLQLPLVELESFIQEQVNQNPLLEISDEENGQPVISGEEIEVKDTEEKELVIDENDFNILKNLDEEYKDHFSETYDFALKRSHEDEKIKAFQESSICAEISLYGELIKQAHETFEDSKELEIAEIIIGYIDEWGFLKTPLNEIALLHNLNEEKIQAILKEIQAFEPCGVGAASIQESLLIQLRCLNKQDSLAYQIVLNHYDDLLHNRIPAIQKGLKLSVNKIQEAIENVIAKLDLHPGTHFSLAKAQVLVPDVTLRQEGKELVVDVNRDFVSNLRICRQYFKLLEDPQINAETKQFIRHHVFSAKWLVRNLQQRYSTIERIADSLAKRQYKFFTDPNGHLVPLTMKMLAEELKVHESTIARTVSNKYINSPRGLIPLRSFFTNEYVSEEGESLSSKTVQEAIHDVVRNEDKCHPLSDEKISAQLKEKGISCARRTVAKYRAILKLGNTTQRRKYK